MTALAIASAILPRAAFRSALATVKPAVDRRNTIPVLSTALIRASAAGGVEVVGCDLDMTITARIPDASADAAFAAALPLHVLADLEKKARASGELSIDSAVLPTRPTDAAGVVLEQKTWSPEIQKARNAAEAEPARLDFQGLSVTLNPLPHDDFPTMTLGAPVKSEFDMASADLLAMLAHVEGCISAEETRYYLNGVYMHATEGGALRIVATDGHRLGKIETPAPEGAAGMPGVIVPRATVNVLMKLCKAKGGAPVVRVTVNTTKILFTFGNVSVLSKLVDGTFPDYGRVIPSYAENVATFDRLALAESVKSVSAMSSERGRAVKFSMGPGTLALIVTNPDAGSATMTMLCDMPEPFHMDVGFNAAYVLDILGTLEGERVTFHLADAGSPALIRDERGAEAEFVLMPMRV